MKIITWNVNGIRSVFRSGFMEWLIKNDPDIVCLQEIKAESDELPEEMKNIDGYYSYFNSSAVKKGHSGVAVYTKIKPIKIETKIGIERFDDEGRCLKLTFEDFILYNFYIPNGARDKKDIPYKLVVYEKLLKMFSMNNEKPLILAGDFNIAHAEIDVFNAKHNLNNTMFTPEERKQLDKIEELGYVDTFRNLYPSKAAYTWWPYMADLRERDIGWRIDYIYVPKSIVNLVKEAFTQRETPGSDHGPYGIVLDLKVKTTDRPVYEKVAQKGLF